MISDMSSRYEQIICNLFKDIKQSETAGHILLTENMQGVEPPYFTCIKTKMPNKIFQH